jgi:hypothetical protein
VRRPGAPLPLEDPVQIGLHALGVSVDREYPERTAIRLASFQVRELGASDGEAVP